MHCTVHTRAQLFGRRLLNRSLVTKLDAANHFTSAHLDNPANWSVVERADTVYSAGFFLTVSVDSMIKVPVLMKCWSFWKNRNSNFSE